MNLRLFVAIEPPETVRRRLGTLQAELQRHAGSHSHDVKWVNPESIHLTLQFLGAVPEERGETIETALAEAAQQARPLALEVRGVGGFPNARRPRVIWAGVHGEIEVLAALVADLGRRLAPLGYPPEDRPFSPHITLGRARNDGGAPGLGGALAAVGGADGMPWRVDTLILFESQLSPAGPQYLPLARLGLGKGRAG